MGQDLLCVLQSLCHLCILAVKSCSERILTSFSLQVYVCHQFLFARKNNLGFVGKVNLNNFITESEHNGMLGLHPFLDIAVTTIWGSIFVKINFVIRIEIVSEMLQESHFFLKLSFSRVFTDFVRSDRISFITSFLLNVFKVVSIFINNYLSWIIEIDSSWSVRKQISKTVFCWIVNPLFNMNFWVNDSFFYIIDSFTFFTWRLLFLLVTDIFWTWLLNIFWWSSEIIATWSEIFRFWVYTFLWLYFLLNLFLANSLEIARTCFLR